MSTEEHELTRTQFEQMLQVEHDKQAAIADAFEALANFMKAIFVLTFIYGVIGLWGFAKLMLGY